MRTHHGLARVFAGKATGSILAHGTARSSRRCARARRHSFELSVDEHGQLVIISDLATGHAGQIERTNGHFFVAFSASTADFYPLLRLDLGVAHSAAASDGATAAMALSQQPRADVSWLSHGGATLVTTRSASPRSRTYKNVDRQPRDQC